VHDDRPLALDREPPPLEIGDDLGEHGVVKAFAELDVKPHAQSVVNPLERTQTVRHELFPERSILRVAGVQPGGLGLGRRLDGRIPVFDPILSQPIQPGELAHGVNRIARLVAGVLPAPEDHAKLGAPVTQVVVSNYPIADRRMDAGQAVANHGRAQVPHVHWLGDIGRREVDDDGLRPRGRLEAKRLIT
jgi:hypothetical protein